MNGSTSHIILGITGACFGVVLAIFLCFLVYRYRFLKQDKSRFKYRKIGRSETAFSCAPKTNAKPTDKLPVKKSIIPAHLHRVSSWNEQSNQPLRKPRSISCPVQPDVVKLESAHSDDFVLSKRSTEKPKLKRKSSRKRAITDGSYHVCQMQCSLFYNHYNSKLFVKVVCVVNIPSVFGVTYGSYIKLMLLPCEEKRTTNIQFHTNNPVFDESFEFPDINTDQLLNKSLKIKLFTIDRFSRSTCVGTVLIDFSELDMDPVKPTTIWRPMSNANRPASASTLADVLDKGELYVSLRYQVFSNKLTVVIMKATNLPQVNKIFSIDPYVTVKLLLHLKVEQVRRTSCKWRTTSPCWNEPLVFEVDSKIPISEYSLCLKIMSRNSLSEDMCIGELQLGYHSDGLCKQHWKEMIVKRNQDRAMCHKIF